MKEIGTALGIELVEIEESIRVTTVSLMRALDKHDKECSGCKLENLLIFICAHFASFYSLLNCDAKIINKYVDWIESGECLEELKALRIAASGLKASSSSPEMQEELKQWSQKIQRARKRKSRN